MPADTGFPRADVENDFLRARRRQVLARLAQRLRREPDDVNLILPFDEVVAALGRTGERSLGLQTIRLDTRRGHGGLAAGTSTAASGPPRAGSGSAGSGWRWPSGAASPSRRSTCTGSATCTSSRTAITGCRSRWPPGQKTIDAYVTEILTAVPAKGIQHRGDLLFKSYERLFRSRVKLPAAGVRQDQGLRSVVLRRAGRGRGSLGLPAHAARPQVLRPRRGRPGAGSPRSSPRSCGCCARPT